MPLDFGDAPDSRYSTLASSDGARHRLIASLTLGATVDAEPDGQPNEDATGDGADEDGVTFGPLVAGESASATVVASAAGKLDAWIDFDGDGDWDDADEQIAARVTLAPGPNPITFPVSPGAHAGTTFARCRLSTAGGLSPKGEAADGEVEDQRVTIVEPTPPPTATATPTATAVPTKTATATPTETPPPTPTRTFTPLPTATVSPSPTATATPTIEVGQPCTHDGAPRTSQADSECASGCCFSVVPGVSGFCVQSCECGAESAP